MHCRLRRFHEIRIEYFEAADAQGLAESIQNWLTLYRKGEHPKSDNMPWLTWRESANRLLKALIRSI